MVPSAMTPCSTPRFGQRLVGGAQEPGAGGPAAEKEEEPEKEDRSRVGASGRWCCRCCCSGVRAGRSRGRLRLRSGKCRPPAGDTASAVHVTILGRQRQVNNHHTQSRETAMEKAIILPELEKILEKRFEVNKRKLAQFLYCYF
ncbi:thiosulfate sulfurtransferase/rhodanese-like domain-containing protein 3 isoform X2 [Ursus maritimus]|uniref:Thiosulfate sulfurtransferase/rhodanese-like domain-containing protein 3 isoform X2 n=1 Tax=Ursus maritimus TaxID=29073 RepID=A0A8M1FN72_URSMA|nr:thiosulfate sulfurtransferase/rhodanese-like domain-containing protein 3 isoform X2 [Ursus maritimus]